MGRRTAAALVAGGLVSLACTAGAYSASLPAPNPDSRDYELVSPPYKTSGTGVGRLPTRGGQGGLGAIAGAGSPSYVGERFAVNGSYGSVLTEGGVPFATDVGFAERTDDASGWTTHSPLTHPAWELQLTRFLYPSAGSRDLGRIVWTANGPFGPFPEMAGWNIATVSWSDWLGRWELVGPTSLDQMPSDPGGGAFNGDPLNVAVAADGAALVADTGTRLTGQSGPRGMAGEGDPTAFHWPDLASPKARNVYRADTRAQPSDNFAGTGVRVLVNSCSGAAGERTRIPRRTADGKLDSQACDLPDAGRDSRLISRYGAALTLNRVAQVEPRHTLRNIISRDGARQVFMSPDPVLSAADNPGTQACTADVDVSTSCPAQIYLSEVSAQGNATVTWISRPAGDLLGSQDAGLLAPSVFEGASEDGDKIFFRTMSPLTPDDPNGTGGAGPVTTGNASPLSWDLYMYDVPDGGDGPSAAGQLTRISAGPNGTGDCNNPQQGGVGALGDPTTKLAGSLRYVSADGTKVYFSCAAPLPGVSGGGVSGITAPGGTPTTEDQTNVYLYDASQPHAERWRFVARLPRAMDGDNPAACASVGITDQQPVTFTDGSSDSTTFRTGKTAGNCWSGSADGSLVTFWTTGRLVSGDPDDVTADMYAYNAGSDVLVRVSAPAAGQPQAPYTCVPDDPATPAKDEALACFGDPTLAGGAPLRPLGIVTDPVDGKAPAVFFESRARLLAADENDVYDVYMWRDGELSLITTGAADAASALYLGNDAAGRNAYFVTRDRLSWQDVDAVADVYVARVAGGIAEPDPPTICLVLAGGCQGGGAGQTALPETKIGAAHQQAEKRLRVKVRRPSSAVLRRARRTGRLPLVVSLSKPARVAVTVRARVKNRVRLLDRVQRDHKVAGRLVVRLKLAGGRRARRLTVRVATPNALTRVVQIRMPRHGR